jgi:hypothetical protein
METSFLKLGDIQWGPLVVIALFAAFVVGGALVAKLNDDSQLRRAVRSIIESLRAAEVASPGQDSYAIPLPKQALEHQAWFSPLDPLTVAAGFRAQIEKGLRLAVGAEYLVEVKSIYVSSGRPNIGPTGQEVAVFTAKGSSRHGNRA